MFPWIATAKSKGIVRPDYSCLKLPQAPPSSLKDGSESVSFLVQLHSNSLESFSFSSQTTQLNKVFYSRFVARKSLLLDSMLFLSPRLSKAPREKRWKKFPGKFLLITKNMLHSLSYVDWDNERSINNAMLQTKKKLNKQKLSCFTRFGKQFWPNRKTLAIKI